MKKTFLALALLSLSAPFAFAHENHDHGDDSTVVKPQQSVRKAGKAQSAAEDTKKVVPPAPEKTEESAPPAPKTK